MSFLARPRRLLMLSAVAGVLSVAGCGSAADDRDVTAPSVEASTATEPVDVTPSSTSTTQPAPVVPAAVPFQPLADEVAVEAKQVAADLVVAAGTYDAGAGTLEGAMERIQAIGGDPMIADAMGNLLLPDASASVEIVYPQLGGLTETQASIILVIRQHLADSSGRREVTRTLDVRVASTGDRWAVEQVASDGGSPPIDPPPPSEAAQAALADPRLTFPDTARWDIEAGRVDDRVLVALVDAAAQSPLTVTTMTEGHPLEVFGTQRTSNHTEGRAVDIWAVGGTPVIALRDEASAARRVVDRLFASGVEELGSPWDLDGAGASRSFTNTVHQDHLHLAFDR